MEADTGKPVVTVLQATVWKLLDLAGAPRRHTAMGRLLREATPPRVIS